MRYILCFVLLLFAPDLNAQTLSVAQLQTGDLLFQDLDCGDLCDAIESVTQGYEGRNFSHVGMVLIEQDSLWVVESIGAGVHRTELEQFRRRSAHPLTIGRLKPAYTALIPEAVQFIRQQFGVPYDDEFLYNNGKYYCSELLYDAFKHANQDQPFFQLEPMTYKQPGSDHYFPVWQQYFAERKMPVPEGQPGCNPGGISRSPKITIIGTIHQ